MANRGSQLIKRSTLLEQLLRSVLYSKHDIIAINKPYGLPVQGNAGFTLLSLLEDFAKARGLKSKPHLANRLDRDSTGILLLSSSQTSAQYLAEIFRERTIRKTYWSVVVGTPKYDQGRICIPLREATVNGRHVIVPSVTHRGSGDDNDNSAQEHTKAAETNFKILAQNHQTCSLLELHPITGYKHQLRVHLAKGLHTPILGDHKYSNEKQQPQILPLRMLQMLGFKGIKNENTGKRKIQPWQRSLIPLHLHAKQVSLPGLTRDPIVIKAPLPDHFKMTLSSLKLDPFRTDRRTLKQGKVNKGLQELGISTNLKTGF